MRPSVYKRKKIQEKKEKAIALYKEGLSTREVAKILERSHNWVAIAVRELSTVK
jgi:hypothetical protein